jgi:hypothetical protein
MVGLNKKLLCDELLPFCFIGIEIVQQEIVTRSGDSEQGLSAECPCNYFIDNIKKISK